MALNEEIKKTEKLFTEFPAVTTDRWIEAINKDLKDADYEKLFWQTIENLTIKPFYRAEDLSTIGGHLNSFPDEFPYVRGNKKGSNDWKIHSHVNIQTTLKANKVALSALKRGADSIGFNASKIKNISNLEQLLNKIEIENISLHFHSFPSVLHFVELFANYINSKKIDKSKVNGWLDFDPLGNFMVYGNKPFTDNYTNNWIDEAIELLKIINKELPSFRAVNVNGRHFHNAGANAVQELAFALALGNEYLALLTACGLRIDEIAPKLQFAFGIGSRYFIEIAKFRAVRFLWANIVNQYKPKNIDSCKMFIHAETSLFNKTNDVYINILRTTTEAMSAIIAGADSICVLPFDFGYSKPNNFSERIAQNIQLILKYESYFDKVIDASAGSYYIENLTEQIAEKSWELFQKIEEKGGFIESIKLGFIQREIEKTLIQQKEKKFEYK